MNLGVPVELTATDVRPYFQHQELLGRLPASDFALHVFDQGQELPFSLPPGRPEEGRPEENRYEENREPVPITVEEPVPAPTAFKQTPATSAPQTHAPQPVVEEPSPEETVPPTEPLPEPPAPKRRGRPPGSKNKPRVCPNCTASSKCVAHCEFCKSGLACTQHTVQDRCGKCTRTRPCAAYR